MNNVSRRHEVVKNKCDKKNTCFIDELVNNLENKNTVTAEILYCLIDELCRVKGRVKNYNLNKYIGDLKVVYHKALNNENLRSVS